MADNKVSISVELAIQQALSEVNKLNKKFDQFSKDAKSGIAGVDRAMNVFKGTIGALGLSAAFSSGIRAVKAFANTMITEGVAAAQVQEAAVNSMEVALSRLGQTSAQTSQEIQAWASQLQQSTGIGDETTLELFALSAAFTDNKDKAKLATQAAMELSAAAQISLQEATRRVGRAFQGSTEDISKFAPAIRGLTKEQLAAGDAARMLIDALGGTAAARMNTFAGAVDAAKASFGDMQEEIGFIITESPAILAAIQTAKKAFESWGASIKGNKGAFQDLIQNGIVLFLDGLSQAVTIADGIIRGFQGLFTGLELVVSAAIANIATTIQALTLPLRGVALAIDKISGSNLADAFSGLDEFASAAREDVAEVGNELIKTFSEEGEVAVRARAGIEVIKTDFLKATEDMRIAQSEANDEIVAGAKNTEKLKRYTAEQGLKDSMAISKAGMAFAKGHNKEVFNLLKAAAIATATVQTAQLVVATYKEYGWPWGLVAGAAAAAAGAAQIATISAESFQTGGIVPGTPSRVDNTVANVASGEMILNRAQQENLFNAINSNQIGRGGGTYVININNPVVDSSQRIKELARELSDAVQYDNVRLLASGMA